MFRRTHFCQIYCTFSSVFVCQKSAFEHSHKYTRTHTYTHVHSHITAQRRIVLRVLNMECVDVVVKIGGSACTKKAEFETLNEVALGESAAQLAALAAQGTSLAIVHGAGSFGHQYARQYKISSGGQSGGARPLPAITREGFAKTRLSVSKLNRFVTEVLVEHGLPAVSLCPCPFVCTTGTKLSGGRLPEISCEWCASSTFERSCAPRARRCGVG